MPVIKSILPLKSRVVIYLDDDRFFPLKKNVLKKLNLTSGDELSNEMIDSIIDKYVYPDAKNLALRITSKQMVSEGIMKVKLKNWKFPDSVIDKIILELKNLDLINDKKYAKEFILYKMENDPCGKNRIIKELKFRFIPDEIIFNLINELYPDEKEIEILEKYINTQILKHSKEYTKNKRKLINHLLYKGFSPENVFSILNKLN